MRLKTSRPYRIAGILLILLLLQIACSLSGSKKSDEDTESKSAATATKLPTRTPRPTLTPLSQFTDTPLPTDTPAATDTPALPPTPDLTAEANAKATQDAASGLPKIEPYLRQYGFSSNQGHIAWTSSGPTSLKLESYREKQFEMAGDGQIFTDFIFHTEVTWQSAYGWIVCGLTFRTQPDLERGAQYQFIIGRGAPWLGKNYWDIEYWKNGNWMSTLTGKVMNSDAIDVTNGATNTLAIVVQGNQFIPYINGTEHMIVSDSNEMEGAVAFFAWQQSGKTTCTYDNAWVWVID